MKPLQLLTLKKLLEQNSRQEGITPTVIPGVEIFKASSTSTPLPTVYQPSLCVLAQGEKQVFVGTDRYQYRAGQFLTVTVDLPLHSEITKASAAEPYLLLKVNIEMTLIAELYSLIPTEKPLSATAGKALVVGEMDAATADAVMRLADLMTTLEHIPVLAESIKRELFYRLLCSDFGPLIAQTAIKDSSLHRISKAIQWVKQEFRKPLSVEDLARLAGMSVSSFHTHFKNITGLSPLQYQKSIRLLAARNLMAAENLDAASTAYQVGYESPSQFSREYARMFGNPPARDINLLKQNQNWRAV
jgi:AraC-like DNA-binding protein